MWKNKKFRGKSNGKRYGKRLTPTQKAYRAGIARGKYLARKSRAKRW